MHKSRIKFLHKRKRQTDLRDKFFSSKVCARHHEQINCVSAIAKKEILADFDTSKLYSSHASIDGSVMIETVKAHQDVRRYMLDFHADGFIMACLPE